VPDAFGPPCRFPSGEGSSEPLVEAGGAGIARDHAESQALSATSLDADSSGAQEEGSDATALQLAKHVERFEQGFRLTREKAEREAGNLSRWVLDDEKDGVGLGCRLAEGDQLAFRVKVLSKDPGSISEP